MAIDPFFTTDDLDAINQFDTDLKTKLASIDNDLTNLDTDTTFKKTQTNDGARAASSGAQDDAISRGIFKSSVKDATLYDIEAQRSLSTKFLEDNLATARLTAGTNKQILGTAKEQFDKNMAARKLANAQGVNDAQNTAWSVAQAAWASANPGLLPSGAVAPGQPGYKPPAKGLGAQVPLGGAAPKTTVFAPTPTNTAPAKGTSKQKPKVKTSTAVYGNTP